MQPARKRLIGTMVMFPHHWPIAPLALLSEVDVLGLSRMS